MLFVVENSKQSHVCISFLLIGRTKAIFGGYPNGAHSNVLCIRDKKYQDLGCRLEIGKILTVYNAHMDVESMDHPRNNKYP